MFRGFETIKSRQNALLKDIRSAFRRGALTDRGLLPIEGPTLLREALKSHVRVKALLIHDPSTLDAALHSWLKEQRTELFQTSRQILDSLADTDAPPGMIALAQPPAWEVNRLLENPDAVFLMVVELQDPGNMGTMIRSAEAFGVTSIFTTKGTVNVYNPKSVRASAGSIFRVPIFHGFDEETLFGLFDAHQITTVAASLRARHPLGQKAFRPPLALLIGQEARGLREETVGRCKHQVRIPMAESVQSLNAAIAAGILLYEIRKNEQNR